MSTDQKIDVEDYAFACPDSCGEAFEDLEDAIRCCYNLQTVEAYKCPGEDCTKMWTTEQAARECCE